MSNEKKEVCIFIQCDVSTGYVGSSRSEKIEVWVFEDDDEATIDEKCEEAANDWLHQNISFNWNIADEIE